MANRPIHWHEGMFLRPHHFQAVQRYWQDAAHRSEKLDVYYNWGLRAIDIDTDALANYRFEVLGLSARLRDGTVLDVPEDGLLPALELKPFLEQQRSVTISLGLPVVHLAKSNVAQDGNVEGARYLLDTQELEDENTGVNPQPIQVRLLNLRLLVSPQDTTGYEVIPLARVQKSIRADAAPELDEIFIPPVLTCDAWRVLHIGILRNLFDRIGKKIEVLALQVESRGITLETHAAGDAIVLSQLRELNHAYSRLQVLSFAQGIHPLLLYLELCGLVGNLSIFGPTRRVPELPRYDHDDLGGCFFTVKQRLDELLDLMVEPVYKERPFVGTGMRMQVAMESTWLDTAWQLFVGVQSPLPPEEVIRLLTVSGQLDMKIGSSERVDSIYRMGQAGLQFIPRPQPPRVLPAVSGLIYFQVRRDTQMSEWQNVLRSLSLAIRLNENRISGNIQGQKTITVTVGHQTFPLQFTLYVVPAGENA